MGVSGIVRVATRDDTQIVSQSGFCVSPRVVTRQNLRPVWGSRGATRGDTPKLTPSLGCRVSPRVVTRQTYAVSGLVNTPILPNFSVVTKPDWA